MPLVISSARLRPLLRPCLTPLLMPFKNGATSPDRVAIRSSELLKLSMMSSAPLKRSLKLWLQSMRSKVNQHVLRVRLLDMAVIHRQNVDIITWKIRQSPRGFFFAYADGLWRTRSLMPSTMFCVPSSR